MITAELKDVVGTMIESKTVKATITRGNETIEATAVNPGGWFGKTWLIGIGGGYSTAWYVVEADHESAAIDEFADSEHGHHVNVDESDLADYDPETCQRAGNDGHVVDLDWLTIDGDDRTGFAGVRYHHAMTPAEGVQPTDWSDYLERRERVQGYELDVRNPGKFQGEARYVPYFHERWNDGCADVDLEADGAWTAGFDVDADDRLLFPELAEVKRVVIYEDDQGFVREGDADFDFDASTDHYEVVVGNVGSVHSGYDESEARAAYAKYVEQSQMGIGRACGENVTLYRNDEIDTEHDPESTTETDVPTPLGWDSIDTSHD
jgi:hypothetical protein